MSSHSENGGTPAKKLLFEVTIEMDHHPVKFSAALKRELAQDIASAVCGNEDIEGNGVSCKVKPDA